MSRNRRERMNAFVLQLKGDKSSSLFSQVTDVESLSQTWKLCTKVAAHLDQGERLENLSWRLFYVHSVMTSESPDGSRYNFKRLSNQTGQKLDREKHLRLSQLEAPRFKGRCKPHTVYRPPNHPGSKCDGPSSVHSLGNNLPDTCGTFTTPINTLHELNFKNGCLSFESLLASLSPLPLFSAINYLSQVPQNNEAVLDPNFTDNYLMGVEDHIARDGPSLESEKSSGITQTGAPMALSPPEPSEEYQNPETLLSPKTVTSSAFSPPVLGDWVWGATESAYESTRNVFSAANLAQESAGCDKLFDRTCFPVTEIYGLQESKMSGGSFAFPGMANSHGEITKETEDSDHTVTKPGEKRKRRNPMATRPPTFIGAPEKLEPAFGHGFTGEPSCTNCQSTQTPLWRRGPNDELLCNACGVFYKVHKKNRPDNLRKLRYSGSCASFGGEMHRSSPVECSNCGAKATPMWRRAPDGNLMCNACALYLKCHNRPRPANTTRPVVSQVNCAPGGSSQGGPILVDKNHLQCSTQAISSVGAGLGSDFPNHTPVNKFESSFSSSVPSLSEITTSSVFYPFQKLHYGTSNV